MKQILMILIVIITAMQISAGVRTPADALRIADEFVSVNASPAARAVRQHMLSDGANGPAIADSSAVYYAVNTTPGYVLVGADDRMPEVLGYGEERAFEPGNMSPALRFWLECYAEELSALSDNAGARAPRKATAAIAPLMSSKWNQSAPYNDFAPAYNDNGGKCVTGCVATAMAQVMYYYKHPVQGTGSHSYLWVCTNPVGKSGTLSANFGQTTYRWDDMIDYYPYSSGGTVAQNEAVATLMYHCGVAVNMGYGQSSGAYTEKVPGALKDYFSYDANYQRIQKVMYPADSLNAIIAAELKANRPVIVSGHNDEGGHAFVCDGCDNKGYFHINWGWGGSNDGYYLLTALNPGKSQGIGGTSKGYNKSTAFFIGLQPTKSGTPKAIPQMATSNFSVSTTSVNRGTNFTVSIARLENFGLTDFTGIYGVALYDEDETRLVRVLKQVDNCSLGAGYHWTTAANVTVSIPSSTTTVPNGTYHLCCVYKDANYGWMRMLCTEDDYYRTLEISTSKATFYANDAEPELALTKAIAFPAGTNPDSVPKTGIPVSFAVKNTGGTFRGQISARIYKGNFSKGQYELVDSAVIRRNQTLQSALQQEFDKNLLLETQYKMKLCWRASASDSWHDFTPAGYAELPFKLYDSEYHLSLTDTIRFDRNDSVPRDNANLYYSIKNTGAPFDGELQASFYQEPFTRGKSEIKTVHIGTNEMLASAFSGPLEQVPGTYTVILRYREPDGEWQEFLDKDGYNLGAITATIVPEPPLEIAYTDAVCDGSVYAGYGFEITAADLAPAGESKEYVRINPDKYQRDSIITLKLSVIKNDTTDVDVMKLNNELPYTVDEYYTIEAGTEVGSFIEIKNIESEYGCSYKRYNVTIDRCQLSVDYSDKVCAESDYEGYGFSIAAADLAPAGESKQFSNTVRSSEDCDSLTTLTLTTYAVKRRTIEASICSYEFYEFDGEKLNVSGEYTYNGTTVDGCDSIVTLNLTVTESDTVDMEPVTVTINSLPYEVDAFYTVPAEAVIGSFEEVVKNADECAYNRYFITVTDDATGWKFIADDPSPITHKIIRDGMLLIIYNGNLYNAQGALIKHTNE